MDNCLFCKIWRAEIPAEEVYRDDKVMAFRDIHPKAPVHILLIPKKHLASLAEATPEDEPLLGELIYRAKSIAESLSIAGDGYRVIINTRAHSGQEVDHIHLHLLGGQPLGPMIVE